MRTLRAALCARRTERVEIATRRASSSSERVAPRVLRARDRTSAARPSSRAIGAVQAPTSARAIRLPGPQTGALRAGGRARLRHRIRGREAINAPQLAGEDVVRAAQPSAEAGPPAREEVLDGIAHLRACVGVYKCQSGSVRGRVGGRAWFEARKTHPWPRRGRPTRRAVAHGWWAQGESNPRPPVKTGGPGSSQWTLIRERRQ